MNLFFDQVVTTVKSNKIITLTTLTQPTLSVAEHNYSALSFFYARQIFSRVYIYFSLQFHVISSHSSIFSSNFFSLKYYSSSYLLYYEH